jgi:hypothetical protein
MFTTKDKVNCWWFVLIPLGCLWILPMFGAHEANMPRLFFVAVAVLWIVVFLFAQPLYDSGTILLRKLGRDHLADFRDRLKPEVLPPARVTLLIMAAVSIFFALL